MHQRMQILPGRNDLPAGMGEHRNCKKLAAAQLKASGHDELSLLSLSHRLFPISRTCHGSHCRLQRKDVVISSQPQTDSSVLKYFRKFKIPKDRSDLWEAGTQRLRDIINKTSLRTSFMPWNRLYAWGETGKTVLYDGPPGETMEDLEGIANIAKIMDLNFQIMGRAGEDFSCPSAFPTLS